MNYFAKQIDLKLNKATATKNFPFNIYNLGPYWLYTDLALLWKHWLNTESIKTFIKGTKKCYYLHQIITRIYKRRIL